MEVIGGGGAAGDFLGEEESADSACGLEGGRSAEVLAPGEVADKCAAAASQRVFLDDIPAVVDELDGFGDIPAAGGPFADAAGDAAGLAVVGVD